MGTTHTDEILGTIRSKQEPVIQNLRVDQLTVDHRYQRPLDMARVRRMAASFDRQAIGVLHVNLREDGTLVVVDGQHRQALVAMVQGDQATVPCIVYYGLTIEEEASLYRKLNATKRPGKYQDFRAGLIAGDPVWTDIARIVEGHGFRLTGNHTNPTVLRSISAAEAIYRRYGPATLAATLATIRSAWRDEPYMVSYHVLMGLALFLSQYGDSCGPDDIGRALSLTRPADLIRQAQALGEAASHTRDVAVAYAVWLAVNRRRRQKLAPFDLATGKRQQQVR